MAKGQLDFHAPLMSARRYSSPSKSSELVKWKNVEKPQPCRQQSLQPQRPERESEVTKPASVPFHWEQIPGRPKGEAERVSGAIRHALPRGRVSGPARFCSGERSNEAFSFTDHAGLLEKLDDSLECRDGSDSESGDDAYSDAVESLAMSESRSFNYSVSGISGCLSSGVKPSGTFCIDTQTRDFMMNRFLPAAKAVVLEIPDYAAKKSSLVKDTTPEQAKKVVSGEMRLPLKTHYSQYMNCIDKAEREDEDQESSAAKKKTGKTWGILPRFCVKNSLCLMNPLPALKLKPKSRCPSPRMTRNAHSGPLDKSSCQVVQKKKSHSGLLSRDPGQFLSSGDSHRSAGASPLRRYRSGNVSPYRNESPKSPFREGVGLLGVPKEAEAFNTKIASSRKMFRALQDVSRNQINVKKKDLSSKMPPPSTKAEEFANSLMVGSRKPCPKSGPTAKILPSSYSPKPGYAADADVVKEEQKVEMDTPLKSPLPPPLPKSPTESWLWRTLPSISLGNPFANLLHQKNQGVKISATNTRWETIVKTSYLQHDHGCYSEELVHSPSYRNS